MVDPMDRCVRAAVESAEPPDSSVRTVTIAFRFVETPQHDARDSI
jgi:hypothetical protein